MKSIANIITGSRIVFSIALLFITPFSPMFYVTVARQTNTVSAFGAKFDTIADFVFVAVCLIKLLPVFTIPVWLWIWIAVIALLKVINIISSYVKQKKWIAPHTVMNKITGALCFLLPFTLSFINLKYSAIVV